MAQSRCNSDALEDQFVAAMGQHMTNKAEQATMN
jgi:hypothetical protein